MLSACCIKYQKRFPSCSRFRLPQQTTTFKRHVSTQKTTGPTPLQTTVPSGSPPPKNRRWPLLLGLGVVAVGTYGYFRPDELERIRSIPSHLREKYKKSQQKIQHETKEFEEVRSKKQPLSEFLEAAQDSKQKILEVQTSEPELSTDSDTAAVVDTTDTPNTSEESIASTEVVTALDSEESVTTDLNQSVELTETAEGEENQFVDVVETTGVEVSEDTNEQDYILINTSDIAEDISSDEQKLTDHGEQLDEIAEVEETHLPEIEFDVAAMASADIDALQNVSLEQATQIVVYLKQEIQRIKEDAQIARDQALVELQQTHEENLNTQLENAEKEFEESMASALEKQKQSLSDKWKDDLERMTSELTHVFGEEREARRKQIEELGDKILAFEEVMKWNVDYEHLTRKVKNVSQILLALDQILETSEPFTAQWSALSAYAQTDPVIGMAVKSVAPNIQSVPTLNQLQTRFNRVENAARQAAMSEDNGLWRQLLAAFWAKFLVVEHDLVQGEAPQARITRAGYFLENDDLYSAVVELDALSGLEGTIVCDWVHDAKTRLLVVQAIEFVRAHVLTEALQLD